MSNQGNNTIIGLRYTVNNDYQKFIHDKTNNILGNENKITVNSLFSSFNNSGAVKDLKNKIEQIASDGFLDKEELKTVLILMDAKLEDKNFKMDSKFELSPQSGIFQATPDEIDALKNIEKVYDYSNQNLNVFPTLRKDNVMDVYDRDGNILESVKLPEQVK